MEVRRGLVNKHSINHEKIVVEQLRKKVEFLEKENKDATERKETILQEISEFNSRYQC
jgi:hypothetical protein